MQVLVYVLLAAVGGVFGAGNPCTPGVKIASSCLEVPAEGCCTASNSVRWCAGGVLCELSCAAQPACGWKGDGYGCAAKPKGDPSCQLGFSCFVDGCAPAWEQKGCCGCPCEDCVCAKDPYCCQNKWDPVCVHECQLCGGCGGGKDGCLASVTPGCGGCACELCVCAKDPSCCTDKWDSLCVALCSEACGAGCEPCKPDCAGKECGPDGCLGLCGLCPAGAQCKNGQCEEICVPDCTNRECGSNGCGGTCGKCPPGKECTEYGKCVVPPCKPACDGKQCGDDGCGGKCGTCDEGVPCLYGECVPGACEPQCKGKECGDDGCGGFCGFCPPKTKCEKALGKCVSYCVPQCKNPDGTTKLCGDDGCGGKCGDCPSGLACADGTCKAPCFPICEGKQCGNDHCLGTCGTCPAGQVCSQAMGYQCVPQDQCVPNCGGKECGDDGCSGNCGNCPGEWYCQSGMCIPSCQPQCLVPEAYVSYKQCGWDECPGQNVCGACPPGFYCALGYVCVEDKCSCDGKECGSPAPGCSNQCGVCPEGLTCDLETLLDPETHKCESCKPTCVKDDGTNKECGSDGCGGTCGNPCPPGFSCDEDPSDGDEYYFQCAPCVPNCNNQDGSTKQCGNDGCGGSCGQCPIDMPCDEATGTCVPCQAQCMKPPELFETMECGPNSCPPGCIDVGLKPCKIAKDCDVGQQCNAMTGMCVACGSCGTCPAGWTCDVETEKDPEIYICEICQPQCIGKECGPNGCGGMCGMCPGGYECTDEGICEKNCDPSAGCLNKQCGPNGCPHGCLEDGQEQCGEWGTCPAGLICDPGKNKCVPCKGTCGTCGEGEYCAADYTCQVIPDPCFGKECGDDGSGGSCGTCEEGFECEGGQCKALVQPEATPEPVADVVTTDQAVEPEAVEESSVSPPEEEPCPTSCPPGYKLFFCKCIKDEEEEKPKSKGGCSASPVGSAHAGLPLVALLLALAIVRRRRAL